MSDLRPPCRCCGATFPSLAAWLSLPLVGRQEGVDPSDTIIIRNCACGSSIAVPAHIEDSAAREMLARLAEVAA